MKKPVVEGPLGADLVSARVLPFPAPNSSARKSPEEGMLQVTQAAELWTLRNGRHAATCIAAPHPLGVEVRYLMNNHPLMSRVTPDWSAVEDIAETWRSRLESKGWTATLSRRTRVRH